MWWAYVYPLLRRTACKSGKTSYQTTTNSLLAGALGINLYTIQLVLGSIKGKTASQVRCTSKLAPGVGFEPYARASCIFSTSPPGHDSPWQHHARPSINSRKFTLNSSKVTHIIHPARSMFRTASTLNILNLFSFLNFFSFAFKFKMFLNTNQISSQMFAAYPLSMNFE